MFTGIIEEVGTIQKIIGHQISGSLKIKAEKVLSGTKIGDSIAVNGVCLTVTGMQGDCFFADVMAETLRKTNLGALPIGAGVNLERAMPSGGRFGGHIVSGHIDGTGTIMSLRPEGNAVWVTISAPADVLRLIVNKGSIAIDGISLTVASLEESAFRVSVIPHTGEATTLLSRKAGDLVNLENDVIGKYVERLLHPYTDNDSFTDQSHITMDYLRTHGF